MKIIIIACSLAATCLIGKAQETDSIIIPKGIAYKYCNASVFENAKSIVQKEFSDSVSYQLNDGILFVGPVLWSRYKKMPALQKIAGGNVTILFNNEKLSAKITQDEEGFKKIWNQLRKELSGSVVVLRKATAKELQYYWSVISFDIEEPLLIAETDDRRFILNISPKNMKLLWLDEVPPNF